MKYFLLTLLFCLSVNAALALEPPTATSANQPESVVADYRSIANYALIIQTGQWASGPSFVSGKDKWYLHGKIISVAVDRVSKPGQNAPFAVGMDVLVTPYCSQGSKAAPNGPGNGCAAFVNRRLQVWALMDDTHAKNINGHLLVQIENPLDAAFTR